MQTPCKLLVQTRSPADLSAGECHTSGSLRFFTAGLLDKGGFCDGDLLEIALDSRGVYIAEPREGLIKIVESMVVPKIQNTVELCRASSIHNPIRAAKVDGKEVPDGEDKLKIHLSPEYIDVPVVDILQLVEWSQT